MKINIFNPEYGKQVTPPKISTQAGASLSVEPSTGEILNLRPQASRSHLRRDNAWIYL